MNEFEEILTDEDFEVKEEEIIPNELEDRPLPDDIFEDDSFSNVDNGLINELLTAKGFKDSKLILVDENNVEKEVNFYELTREEQLEILNNNEPQENDILEEDEITFYNYLRTNNMSVQEFLERYKDSILSEVGTSEPVYEIDSYDDNELFLLDLKLKFDLTDEELQAELEKELNSPEIFTKKVAKLRADYKVLEDREKEARQTELQQQEQAMYIEFVDNMTKVSNAVTDYHGVQLDDEEKVETLSYLSKLDENGVSRFSKDLNDPNKLFKAAWYLRYGDEAFQALESAYEAEIKRLKKELEDKPKGTVRRTPKVESINDLF